MNIGIVVHSQSGHTAQIAKYLGSAFTGKGHDVDTSLLRPRGKVTPRSSSFELKSIPDVADRDCILLGGPVWGFSASPVIMKYINHLGRLTGKKVLCFVTKGLPFLRTGGTQALSKMNEMISLSDATVLDGEIIHTPGMPKEQKVRPVIDRMVASCLG
jgi:NAD(P)H dehydrogenase (quinone)